MWDAILVLRTHLLELEKVSSLVEDFHYRYLQTLRSRVSHEVLIGTSAESDDELVDIGTSDSEVGCGEERTIATITTAAGTVSIPFNINPLSVTMITSDIKQPTHQAPNVKASFSKIPRFDFTSIDLLKFLIKCALICRFCDTISSSNSVEE
uniref:Meis_PKNOX_N domain-containing protein n=1 Tax=Heterorhabditis bacteriophora TaxID=37862 RepID=A0A1I7WSZ0_HETBA